jgi:hypothetical protein
MNFWGCHSRDEETMDTDKLFRLTVQAFRTYTNDFPNDPPWDRKARTTNKLYIERTTEAVKTVQRSCPRTKYNKQPTPQDSTVQGYTFHYVDGETALLAVVVHWSTEEEHIEFILNQLHSYKAPVKVMVLDDSMLRKQVNNVDISVASEVQKSICQYPARIPGDKYLVVMFLDGRMGFCGFDHLGAPIAV